MLQQSVLHRQAGEQLQKAAYRPKKLVLIHTAVSIGSLLLVNVLSYLLSLLIDRTGGLSGMGIRSVLATIQSVFELGITVALPFWEIGLLYAALGWAKGDSSTPADLLAGFRRFGSVLGLRLLQGGMFFLLTFGIFNISYMIFLLTPFASPLISLLEPLIAQSSASGQLESVLTEELIATAGQACVPMFIIFGLLLAAAAIPLFYRVRFADFALMDGSRAAKSLVDSIKLTRKNCLQIAKIDLSFWWFYLLQVLSIAIGYTDSVLPLLGVTLPLSQEVSFFLFSSLSLLAQGLLVWRYQDVVLTTYGLAYRALGSPAPQSADIPQNL